MANKHSTEAAGGEQALVFEFDGFIITPGKDLPEEAANTAIGFDQVPSCTGNGTETVYHYKGFDITVHNRGTHNPVYSIFFQSGEVATPEGLTFGCSAETVRSLYGEPGSQGGYAWIYTDGNAELIILLAEDSVVGIEYRMAG